MSNGFRFSQFNHIPEWVIQMITICFFACGKRVFECEPLTAGDNSNIPKTMNIILGMYKLHLQMGFEDFGFFFFEFTEQNKVLTNNEQIDIQKWGNKTLQS